MRESGGYEKEECEARIERKEADRRDGGQQTEEVE